MQVVAMNKVLLYRIFLLGVLFLTGENWAFAQFLRTRIVIPAGIQIINSGLPNQIIPKEDALFSTNAQLTWIEIRALVNLQLVVEYQTLFSVNPSVGELLVLNDGTQIFSDARPQGKLGFVLNVNPSKTSQPVIGLRTYNAWLGIPYQARSIITIHYP